jgi:hypothetical protein
MYICLWTNKYVFYRIIPHILEGDFIMQSYAPAVTRKKPSISVSKYVMLSFPLGIFYFICIAAGLALSIALAPLFIGLPLLLGVLTAAFAFASYERSLACDVLGIVEYEEEEGDSPPEAGFFLRLKRTLTDPASYLNILFCLLKLPIGLINFTLTVASVLVSICLIAMPGVSLVFEQILGVDLFQQFPQLTEPLPPLTSMQLSLICTAAGIVLLFLSAMMIHLLAAGTAKLTLALAKTKRA